MLLAVTAALAACDGSSMGTPASPPAQPSQVNFTAFTKGLLAIHSDAAQPTPVTTAQFVFPDNDNTQAFASVLPAI
jgi:hypothetical protein